MPPAKGTKKNGGGALGRGIMKQRSKDHRNKTNNAGTGFHAADLELSNNPLQSVIDMSSLEDFLSNAVLADRDFVAEKEYVSFVDSNAGANAAAVAAKKARAGAAGAAGGTVQTLRIPRRPKWTGATTAEELHRAEKDAFLSWRRDVAKLELDFGGGVTPGVDEAAVTPFEKNIEVWRQLWRVVERADVLVQIVDARNPLLYRCPDVEAYANEVNPLKKTLLLINKADYLTPLQRLAWARYFHAEGTQFVFFSAKREQERLEEMDRMQVAAAAARAAAGGQLGDIDEEDEYDDDEEDLFRGAGNDSDGSDSDEDGLGELDHVDGSASDAGGDGPKSRRRGGGASRSLPAAPVFTTRNAMRAAQQDAELAAALRKAFILDDSDSDSDSEGEAKVKEERSAAAADEAGASEAAQAPTAEAASAPAPVPAPAPVKSARPTSTPAASSTRAAAVEPDSDSDDDSDSHGSAPAASAAPGGAGQSLTAGLAFGAVDAGDMAGIESADPLYDACRVLSREELTDLFAQLYGSLPRPPLGTGDEMARARRAEALARARASAVDARKTELARRRDMVRRMVEVGLGASLRYGGLADAAGLGEGEEGVDGELDAEVTGVDLPGASDGGEAGAIGDAHEDRPLMIGMVGYPNVGKSSTINALMGATAANHGAQRVAVASTPGKTKHFQTLVLNDELTLVDCPGLVFPSFVATREELVVSGVLPIDQMRDYVSPVRLVCQRVPRATLEAHYGFRLYRDPLDPSSALRQPTAHELLDAYAHMRGFVGQTHSGYDHARSARILLKDYCEGRVIYVHPPPQGWGGWLTGTAAAGAAAAAGRSDGIGGSGAEPLDEPAAASAAAVLNVLRPAAARRHDGEGTGASLAGGASAAAAATAGMTAAQQAALAQLEAEQEASASAARAAAAAASASAIAQSAPADEGDEYDSDNEPADEGDFEGLDEATLRQFGRVIIGARAPAAAASAGGEGEEEGDDDGSDGEEGTEPGFSVTTGPAGMTIIRTDAPLGIKAKKERSAKIKGIGRYGTLKKGERPVDPYGTEAAADAANREFHQTEMAASAAGPATRLADDVAVLDALTAHATAALAARSAHPLSSAAAAAAAAPASSSAASVVSAGARTAASSAAASAHGGAGTASVVTGRSGTITSTSIPAGAARKASRGPVAMGMSGTAGGRLSKGVVHTVGGQAAFKEIVPAHLRGQVTPAPGAAKK